MHKPDTTYINAPIKDMENNSTQKLHIDLQEGFNQEVIVSLDGKSIYEGKVHTNSLIGLAKSLEVNVAGGKHTLTLTLVGNNNYHEKFDIDTSRGFYVGISYGITGEAGRSIQLIFKQQEKPFGYE